MERIKISDIFVGDFAISQYFGQNMANYKQFNLKGHNGVDFACPLYTPILSGVAGVVLRVKNDPSGYGIYCQIWDKVQKIAIISAHQSVCLVREGDSVSPIQVIGLTGATGYSTGPHLHWGFCPVDDNGAKTEPDNGYSGYVDPLSFKRVTWALRDPSGIFANHFLK